MADHGARNILCLSRSGATGESLQFIEEMDARGVTVVAPKCDVSSREQVARLVGDVRGMGLPPIRGIIQSAMVIRVSISRSTPYMIATNVTRTAYSRIWRSTTGPGPSRPR